MSISIEDGSVRESEHITARASLTERAKTAICEQVGRDGDAVAVVAREFGWAGRLRRNSRQLVTGSPVTGRGAGVTSLSGAQLLGEIATQLGIAKGLSEVMAGR